MKVCTKCGVEKDLDEFFRRKGSSDGRMSSCKTCKTAAIYAWRDKNREKWNEYVKAEVAASARRAARLARSAEKKEKLEAWREANKERLSYERRKRHEDRPEVKSYRKEYRSSDEYRQRAKRRRMEKQASEPSFRLNRRMSSAIGRTLKSGKGGASWQSMVPYTLDRLRLHIERQFLKGMSWENMGEWHVDHILPLASFRFESERDDDFLAAWSLSNLRPLWAKDNLQKHSKVLTLL